MKWCMELLEVMSEGKKMLVNYLVISNIIGVIVFVLLGVFIYFKYLSPKDHPRKLFKGDYLKAAYAISSDNTDKLTKILPKIENIDELGIDEHYTLLMYAVKKEASKSVKLLLKKGANPKVLGTDTNDNQFSAIYLAVTVKDTTSLKILLDYGISPDHKDKNRAIIFDAIAWLNRNAVNLLLEYGADVNQTTELEVSVLQHALIRIEYDLAEVLIEKGANVHHIDKLGRSESYEVQKSLEKWEKDSDEYLEIKNIQDMMKQRGVKFPVLAPKEQRKALGVVWCDDPEGWIHKSKCKKINEEN